MSVLETCDDGRVRILRLNRPAQRNALSEELGNALQAAIRAADADPAVGCMVIRGNGKSFCAGADLEEFGALARSSESDRYGRVRRGLDLFGLHHELGTPLVAAVHGHVLAGGLGLALAAHFTVAAEDTVFGLPELNHGLFPYTVLPLVAEVVGPRRALQLALSTRRLSASEALAWGLVQEVVPADHLAARALELARALAARDPLALATGLDAYRAVTLGSRRPDWEHLSLLRNVAFGGAAFQAAAARFADGPREQPS